MAGPYELGKELPVRQFSLVYKHVFSMEYLYKRLYEWLMEEGYGPDKWMEKLYLERVAGNGAKQIWIWWRTSKNYTSGQGHENPFFKFIMNIDFHCLNLTKQDTIIDGQKVGVNKGEVTIEVTSKIVLDPDKKWQASYVMKNEYLQNFFINRIYKSRIESIENELVKDSARILAAIKQYFQLESWHPEHANKPFHPAKGSEYP